MTEPNLDNVEDVYRVQRNISNDPKLAVEESEMNALEDEVESTSEKILNDVIMGGKEAPWQMLGAPADFVNEVFDLFNIPEAAKKLEESFPKPIKEASEFLRGGPIGEDLIPTTAPARSNTGAAIRGIGQFLTGFIPFLGPASKLAKASKVAKTAVGTDIISGGIAGAATDIVGFDPNDPNVANMISNMNPDSTNYLIDFLKTDPENSELHNRLLNGLVGTMAGTVAEPIVRGFAASLKSLKTKLAPQEFEKMVLDLEVNLKQVEEGKAPPIDGANPTDAKTKAVEEVNPEVPDIASFTIDNVFDEGLDRTVLGDKIPRVRMGAKKEFIKAMKEGNFVDAQEKYIGHINMERIENQGQIREIIGTAAEILERSGETGKSFSWNGTIKLAEDLGMSVEELNFITKDLTNLNGRMKAGADMMAKSAEEVDRLRMRLEQGASNDDIIKYLKASTLHLGVVKTITNARSEIARTMNSFKLTAKSEGARIAQMDSIILAFGGKDGIEHHAGRLGKLLKSERGLHKFNAAISRSKFGRWRDAYLEMYIQGLLSNPKTQMINAVGNASAIGLSVIERKMAERIARKSGSLGGPGGVAQGESSAKMIGVVKGFRDGWRIAKETFKSGEPTDLFSKTDYYRPYNKGISSENLRFNGMTGAFVDFIGAVTNVPGRALMSADEMFKAINFKGEVHAQAHRRATQLGLEGDEYIKVYNDLVAHPDEAITVKALDESHINTFTNQLGSKARKMQQLLESDPTGISKIFIPFFRTPVNLIKFGTARTPLLRRVLQEVRDEMSSDDLATRQLAQAKFETGRNIMITTMGLAAGGMMTGSPPKDPELRRRLLETGWRPYSARVGDKYIPYNRFDPIGMMIGFAVDSFQAGAMFNMSSDAIGNNPEASDAFVKGQMDTFYDSVASIMKNITDRHYLSGVANMLDIIDPDTDFARERALKELINTVPPLSFYSSLRRAAGKTLDPVKRNVEDNTSLVNEISNKIWKSIPGYSDTLPAHYNLAGEKTMWPSNDDSFFMRAFNNMANPFGDVGDTSETHPLLRKIQELQLDVQGTEGIRSIDSVNLKSEEIEYFSKTWGKLNNKLLTPKVKKASFNDRPEGEQAIQLEALLRDTKKAAKEMTVKKFSRITEQLRKQEEETKAKSQSPVAVPPLFQLRSN